MHATLRQNIGDRMAHGLADAQLALRAAGGGTLAVVAGHCVSQNQSAAPAARIAVFIVQSG
jgi:hypothetical protein